MGGLISRYNARLLFLATALLLAMILFAAPWGEFPVNDDWVYARDAFQSSIAGKLVYTGFESAFMIPQVALGAVAVGFFGESFLVLRCLGWMFWMLSAWGLLVLLDRAGASFAARAAALACFVCFPVGFINASSFMTDPFFLAFWTWSLLFLHRSLESRAIRDWTGLGIMLVLAILQRQFGIFLCLTLLYFAWQRYRSTRLAQEIAPELAVSAVALLTLAVAQSWWKSLFHLASVQLQPPLLGPIIQNWMKATITLGLIAAPFMFGFFPGRVLQQFSSLSPRLRRWVLSVAGVLLLEVIYLGIQGEWMPSFGNQISEFGAFRSEFIPGDRDVLIPLAVRVGMTFLGVLGALYLLLQVLVGRRSSDQDTVARTSLRRVLLITSIIYLLGLTVICRVWFDRYLLPLFPAVLIHAQWGLGSFRQWHRFGRMAVAGVLGAFAFWSVDLTQDYFSWNQARWEIGRWAISRGIAADEIVGGYEWEGWYRTLRSPDEPGHGWGSLFKPRPDRVHVGFSMPAGARELHRVEFKRMPWHESGRVFLYEKP